MIRWRYCKHIHTSSLGRSAPAHAAGLRPDFGPKSLKTKVYAAFFHPLTACIQARIMESMTTRPEPTVGTTVRIFQAQDNALRIDYPQLSKSALIRVLLHLFLSKQLPTNVYPLALEEMTRAEQALKSNKTKQVSVA